MLRLTLVFCVLLASALAFQAIAPLEPIPDIFKDQEGCYMKELDRVIEFGKALPSKESCVEYRCSTSHVTRAGCGAIDARLPCEKVEEKEKPYPDCCPKIKCPDQD